MSDPGAALVDVVDDDDLVVRTATRAEVRADNLLHRAVFVALLTHGDEVWVHQRADDKDVWPSRWDMAFGGVVDAGEGWEAAAARELAEEAGVTGLDLTPLGGGRYEDEGVRELARVYLTRHDGPLVPTDGEVVAVDRVPLAELGAWVAAQPIVPDSAALVVPRLVALLGADGPAVRG